MISMESGPVTVNRLAPVAEVNHVEIRGRKQMPRWVARTALAALAIFGGMGGTVVDSDPAAADVGYTTPGIDDNTITCWMDVGPSTDFVSLAAEIESVHDNLPHRRSSQKLIDAVANHMATSNVSLEPGTAKCGWTGNTSPKYWTPFDAERSKRESNAETAGRMVNNAGKNAEATYKSVKRVGKAVVSPLKDAATSDDCTNWHFWDGCSPTDPYSITFTNKATGYWITCSIDRGDSQVYGEAARRMNEDHIAITNISSQKLKDKIVADLSAIGGWYDMESAGCVKV